MANSGLAVLEEALRVRRLDRTLTTTLSPGKGDGQVAPTALAGLDAVLDPTVRAAGASAVGGGLPRGQLSEIAGSRSSGRTTLLLQVLAAATRRGEIAALVDTFDRLDLASVVSAGVDLNRLLWIRGHDLSGPQGSGLVDRTIERALQALNLVLQAGGFGVVAIDLADTPSSALQRIPFTTWLRVQRTIEGSDTVCVLVGPQPLGRSAGGLTLALAGRVRWTGHESSGLGTGDSGLGARDLVHGVSSRGCRLAGMDVTARVVSPRRRVDGEITIRAAQADGTAQAKPGRYRCQ